MKKLVYFLISVTIILLYVTNFDFKNLSYISFCITAIYLLLFFIIFFIHNQSKKFIAKRDLKKHRSLPIHLLSFILNVLLIFIAQFLLTRFFIFNTIPVLIILLYPFLIFIYSLFKIYKIRI